MATSGPTAPVRTVLTAMVAVAVLATGAVGVAWGLSAADQPGYSGANSIRITLRAEEEQSVDVLTVGKAIISASCGAGENPEDPGRLSSGFWFGIRNTSLTSPIMVASSEGSMVLRPNGMDPVFGAGQGAISDNNYNNGMVVPFTIMQQGGPSVSGTVSMWLRAGGSLDGTAKCLFSARARG